jgi:hypothetical protein
MKPGYDYRKEFEWGLDLILHGLELKRGWVPLSPFERRRIGCPRFDAKAVVAVVIEVQRIAAADRQPAIDLAALVVEE